MEARRILGANITNTGLQCAGFLLLNPHIYVLRTWAVQRIVPSGAQFGELLGGAGEVV